MSFGEVLCIGETQLVSISADPPPKTQFTESGKIKKYWFIMSHRRSFASKNHEYSTEISMGKIAKKNFQNEQYWLFVDSVDQLFSCLEKLCLLRWGGSKNTFKRTPWLAPIISVHRALLDCFGEMFFLNGFTGFQIGNGSRNAEDSVVPACA